jgi:hypothetical protein
LFIRLGGRASKHPRPAHGVLRPRPDGSSMNPAQQDARDRMGGVVG